VLGAAGCEKPVVAGVEGDARGRKAVVLRGLLDLSCFSKAKIVRRRSNLLKIHSAFAGRPVLLLQPEFCMSAEGMKGKTLFEWCLCSATAVVGILRVLLAKNMIKEEALRQPPRRNSVAPGLECLVCSLEERRCGEPVVLSMRKYSNA